MAPFFIGLVLVWDNLWASLRRLSETKKSPLDFACLVYPGLLFPLGSGQKRLAFLREGRSRKYFLPGRR